MVKLVETTYVPSKIISFFFFLNNGIYFLKCILQNYQIYIQINTEMVLKTQNLYFAMATPVPEFVNQWSESEKEVLKKKKKRLCPPEQGGSIMFTT